MTKLAELLVEARGTITYRAERAVLDFTGDIDRLVDERDITRSELADRIGASAAYVSKVLRGETNLTVKTMVSFADALDADIRISIVDRKAQGLKVSRDAFGRWQTVGAIDVLQPPVALSAVDFGAANEQQWQTLQLLAA